MSAASLENTLGRRNVSAMALHHMPKGIQHSWKSWAAKQHRFQQAGRMEKRRAKQSILQLVRG